MLSSDFSFDVADEGSANLASAVGQPVVLPEFLPYDTVRVGHWQTDPPKPSAEALLHLDASLANYAKAVELSPEVGLYWLGYGWMNEQAARFATQSTMPATRPAATTRIEIAKMAYADAILAELAADRKIDHDAPVRERVAGDPDDDVRADVDAAVAAEAADYLVELVEADGVTEDEQKCLDVAAWQAEGVTFADGRVLPTWDWMPTAVTEREKRE